jgi:hypothetical protein
VEGPIPFDGGYGSGGTPMSVVIVPTSTALSTTSEM